MRIHFRLATAHVHHLSLGADGGGRPGNMSQLQMKLLRRKIEKRNAKLRQRNLKLQGELC